VLVLPYPPLSLLYLLAVRWERVEPSFTPLVLLAALPLAAVVLGIRGLLGGRERGWHAALLAVAVVELLWAVMASAMIGFAIAARSG
jgi:hypothetical protein